MKTITRPGKAQLEPSATILRGFAKAFVIGVMPISLAVGACGANFSNSDSRSGLVCVDDSQTCITRRQQALQDLTASSDRSWIKQRPGPQAYAAGVRMFAYRTSKKTLSCNELAQALAEAKNAPNVLSGGPAAGLTPAQISRGKMLASEVARDLTRERKRRCRS